MKSLDHRALWGEAIPYSAFVRDAKKNKQLWEGVYRRATIPDWAVTQACERGTDVRLLALVEDWCGDASNTVPVLAKLGDTASCLEMRLIKRDEYPDVMDRYLTNGTRSIPIVIALDRHFDELGHWGPRPTELQQSVMDHKHRIPREELYPQVRRWYARDRGQTTLREVLSLLKGG